jgi:membrane protease YdiL (CAAX protease family)
MHRRKLNMKNKFQGDKGIKQSHVTIQPMSMGVSLLFFGIPALLVFFGFHVVMLIFIERGFTPFYAYFLGLGIPLVLMVVASLVAYRMEGNLLEWGAFKERFRLERLSVKMWLITLGAFIVIIVIYSVSTQINVMLLNTGIIPMPASLPAWLDTRGGTPSLATMDQAFGGLLGNWPALFSYFVLLFINVIGEEFWWRGYVLPRQELAFGNWTWIVHGCLWTLFHAFKWWDILGILPLTFILPFLVWKFKNNTIGIILHFLINGIGLIAILVGILGIANN